MNGKDIELSRRRVLGGIATVGAASAAAGAGTFAAFSDTEDSTGNSISAGTLNLTIDSQDGSATTTVDADITNVAPGESAGDYGGPYASTVSSGANSIDGYLNASFSNVTSEGGDNPESESGTDDGELLSELWVGVYFDDSGDTSDDGDQSVVYEGYANSMATNANTVNHSLSGGSSSNLIIDWSVDQDAGNDIQGDTASFDVQVSLNQETQ